METVVKKDIRPYLPFYMGCEVFVKDKITEASSIRLAGFTTLAAGLSPQNYLRVQLVTTGENLLWLDADQILLKLRPLSDMTEEEFEEFKKLSDNDFSKMALIDSMCKDGGYTRLCHSAFAQQYLLSKGFDLFNLIPEKLAIDKTTLSNTNLAQRYKDVYGKEYFEE